MEKYINITIENTNWGGTVKQYKNTTKHYKGYYSQQEHNRRIEEMEEDYLVRPEYTHLNTFEDYLEELEIVKEISKVEEDYKEHHKRKIPKNFKPFTNGIITFSNTIAKDLQLYTNEDNRKDFFRVIKGFLEEEVGTLISIDFHLDEETPHFHFMAVNYNYEKHLTYSRTITESINENGYRLNYQQDRLEKYLKDNIEGWDYNRGIPKSKKKYKKERKKFGELTKQLEQFKEDIQQIEEVLLEDNKLEDLDKFKILLERYGNSENSGSRLEKLVRKWKKGTQKQREEQEKELEKELEKLNKNNKGNKK